MGKKQYHGEAAFTLIEVLIALVVFAVGILGVALMQMTAIRGNNIANQVSEASVFATDQLERILTWEYNDPRLNSANNNPVYAWNEETRTADGHRSDASGRYNAYWEVTDNSPTMNSKTIDLRVVWERKGEQKRLSLTAVKARK